MSKRQKIIVSITGIFLVLLILVGLTYAYFLTKITGNTNSKSISVTTANLQIKYSDNSAEILGKNLVLEPSSNEIGSKTFTVTNEGNANTSYVVVIENVSITKSTDGTTTTFESNDFRYTLTCTKKDGTNCDGVSTQTAFPINGGILVSNSIDVSDVQTYTLKMWYIDTGIDQSNDMGKTLQAKINIKDITQVENPYSSNKNSLVYNIIESAKNKTNGTELIAVPKVKPGEGISEYKTGKVIKESVTTSSLCSGYDPWLVGDSESAAQSGSSVSSYDEAVGKYVYDRCSSWTKKLLSYDSTNNTLTFESYEIKPESTLSIAEDDYGTTYYYRGAVTDNYVSFANKTWRIVRINGNGSIRLVLDDVAKDSSGSAIDTAFNSSYNDNAYVGYMYGTPGSTTYDATHKNINDSTIKTAVDKWYEDNLKTNYSNYLADTLFCNDKTLASNGIGGVTTQLGYGKNKTYYASTERLHYSTGTTSITTANPTFKCAESATNDYSRFTVNVSTLSNGNKTNGNLKYPIGLLTADEVAYAGAYKYGQTNKTYYLYNSSITSHWRLSSPGSYNGSSAYEWYFDVSDGGIYYGTVTNTYVFRPSINLKAELLVGGGDGTSSNPYTVKLS